MTGENVFCAYCGKQTVKDGQRIIDGPCPCQSPALVDEREYRVISDFSSKGVEEEVNDLLTQGFRRSDGLQLTTQHLHGDSLMTKYTQVMVRGAIDSDEGQKLQIHASLAAFLGDGDQPKYHYLGFHGDPDFYPSPEKREMAKIAFYHLAGKTNPASIRVFLHETAFLYKELAEAHGWELVVHLPEGGVM